MSKNLLNESQIRQFMKLAKLEPLTPGFVEGLSETHGRGMNDAPQYDGRRRVQEEEEMEIDAELDAGAPPMEDELPPEEPAMDAEMALPADDGRMISVDDFLGALETALEGVMGDEVEIDSSEMSDEAPEEEEVDMDVELDAGDGAEMDMGAEEEELMEATDEEVTTETADEEVTTEATDEEVTTEASDELVEQITKRVAARILKSTLTKK